MGLRLGPHELVFGPRLVNVLWVATGQGGGTVEIFGIGGSVGFAAQLTPGFCLLPEVAFNVPLTGQVSSSVGGGSVTFNGFGLTFGVGALFDWGGGGPQDFHPANTDSANPSNLF
jgi:hypothetical protein